MKFTIARQPLVPAFLTLAALAVAAMWCAQTPVFFPAGEGAAEGAYLLSGDIAGTGGRLAIPLPGPLLIHFQIGFPVWSRYIAAFLILFAGMCVGRLTVRYNLYSVGTCLAIPLYALLACPLAAGSAFLPVYAASALLALSVKNFSRSFCNGYGFDAIFRASFYLGWLPFVSAAAVPLLLLLPLALVLFRRTLREATVATAGLLLPALALCYINWGAGGDFTTPLTVVGHTFAAGTYLSLFTTLPAATQALLCGISALTLISGLFFLSDIYAAGTKPRFILLFNICTWVLTLTLLAGPAAARGDTALTAVPAAALLPVLFVRIHRNLALSLYVLLLAAALFVIFLQ